MTNVRGKFTQWCYPLFSLLIAVSVISMGLCISSFAQENGSTSALAPSGKAIAEPTTVAIDLVPALEDHTRTAIEIAIGTWATAWSKQDVPAYLAQYAVSFEPANANLSLDGWRALRKTRLTIPKYIEVSISNLDIAIFDSGVHLATFVQDYKSDVFQERSLKSLEFIEDNGEWKIASERSIRLLD